MIIKTLWIKYEHDMMPNVVLAVDEYLHDENPRYWNEHVEAEISKAEDSGYEWRVMEIEVREKDVENAFAILRLHGEVSPSE